MKVNMTQFEYDYLSGVWDGPKGAAFNAVDEFCGDLGYGDFGKPTKLGERQMELYDRENLGSG